MEDVSKTPFKRESASWQFISINELPGKMSPSPPNSLYCTPQKGFLLPPPLLKRVRKPHTEEVLNLPTPNHLQEHQIFMRQRQRQDFRKVTGAEGKKGGRGMGGEGTPPTPMYQCPMIKLNALNRAPDFELESESAITEHETVRRLLILSFIISSMSSSSSPTRLAPLLSPSERSDFLINTAKL